MQTTIRLLAQVLAFIFCCGLFTCQTVAQTVASQPLKISVTSLNDHLLMGQQASFNCVLLDADNKPAKATHDVSVQIETRLPSGKSAEQSIVIKAGESSNSFSLPATEAGVSEIKAKQKNMLEGGTFFRVRNQRPMTNSISSTVKPFVPPTVVRRGGGLSAEMMMSAERPTAIVAAPQPPPGSPPQIGLILRYEPSECLADGKQSANIYAFLDDAVAEAPVDIQLTLLNDGGEPEPLPALIIPKGKEQAETKITSRKVGIVTVECVRANPAVIREGKIMKIAFGPPIAGITAKYPARISLLENADLLLQLVSENGTEIPTDQARTIDLVIEQGGGDFDSSSVTIPANSATIHARFYPTHHGSIEFSASAPNLPPYTFKVYVFFPVLLVVCSCAGGILGGALAASISPKRRKQKISWIVRIGIGLVTGFVFYYFGVLGMITHIPRQIPLNPFGSVILSIVGGWMGTEVFTPILKALGIKLS